ncbi:protein of unknown function [Thermus arciformis]|uniref:PatA-like N-terminal domain-containing protein n=1 Tax=Thermus arciformis TaxID=482827 RepID=A0A1G7DV77_9DEIN|nr:DUF4388 domain-containing protein [Thermus arciformis]SDE54895.1 protein of unknown function [Thermus arciformis]
MEGDFRLLGPIDLLQLLAQGGKTGAFRVEGGEVYLEGGRPVHAVYRGKEGKEALLALLTLKEGSFRFLLGERAPRTTLGGALEGYLLEALRALDEGVEVGPFDLVRPTPKGQGAQASLEPTELSLLLALEGGKSPLDLLPATGLSLGEVLRRLGQLARLRLVEVVPRVPHAARLRVALGKRGAQVDGLLLSAWRLHYGGVARVRVRGLREASLPVEGAEGLGGELRLAPELLLFHGFKVGEEVLVWPEV